MTDHAIEVSDDAADDDISFFGHDPALGGLVPPGGALPAHLILTLDQRDPRIDLPDAGVGPVLRLVFPFYYEGEKFIYRHCDDFRSNLSNSPASVVMMIGHRRIFRKLCRAARSRFRAWKMRPVAMWTRTA